MLEIRSFTFNAFQENTYVVLDLVNKASVIVDPGCFDTVERKQLDQLLNEYQPVAIVNTHGHLDHVFGVNHLVGKYKIPFYLHEAEAPILRNVPEVSLRYGIGMVAPIDDFTPLEVGKFNLNGFSFDIWHTPGHAPGHVVIYVESLNTVIAGDVLFKESVGRTDFPYCSFQDLENSIRQVLYHLPDSTIVLPGHGPSTTIGHEKRYNPFVPF